MTKSVYNITIQKTLAPGDSRTIYGYMPHPEGYAPECIRQDGYPSKYHHEFNPLIAKLVDQMVRVGKDGTAYMGRSGHVAYTQTCEQKETGLFSYYRYDHYARLIETGEATPLNIDAGNMDACRQMTDADLSARILVLGQRTNVMVAIYNDADPFPLPPGTWHLYDKIDAICYYNHIEADTLHATNEQYYPDESWFEIKYHYDCTHYISTVAHQCISAITATAEANSVTTKEATSYRVYVQQPVAYSYDELSRIASLVYDVVFSKPFSVAGYSEICKTRLLCGNIAAINNIQAICKKIKNNNLYSFRFTIQMISTGICSIRSFALAMRRLWTNICKSIPVYSGSSPPVISAAEIAYK